MVGYVRVVNIVRSGSAQGVENRQIGRERIAKLDVEISWKRQATWKSRLLRNLLVIEYRNNRVPHHATVEHLRAVGGRHGRKIEFVSAGGVVDSLAEHVFRKCESSLAEQLRVGIRGHIVD